MDPFFFEIHRNSLLSYSCRQIFHINYNKLSCITKSNDCFSRAVFLVAKKMRIFASNTCNAYCIIRSPYIRLSSSNRFVETSRVVLCLLHNQFAVHKITRKTEIFIFAMFLANEFVTCRARESLCEIRDIDEYL